MAPRKELIEKSALFLMPETNWRMPKKRFFTESWGKEQLGGASADAQSYWQGRFAACTFVGGFLGIGRTRNSWGVAPNPTRDAVP